MSRICSISSVFVVLMVSISAPAQKLTLYSPYTGQNTVVVVPTPPSAGFTGSIVLQSDCTTSGALIPLDPQPSSVAEGSPSPILLTLKDKKGLAKGADVCVVESFAAKDKTKVVAIPPTISSGIVEVIDRPTIKIAKAYAGDKTIVVTPIPPGPYPATVDVFPNCPPYVKDTASLIDSKSSRSVDTDANSVTLTLLAPLTPAGGKICAVEDYGVDPDLPATTPSRDVSDGFVIADTADVPPPGYDWGLVRAYFTAGSLLSQQDDQFSHADIFLSFRIDKTYLQTGNVNATDRHSWMPGISSFFEPRLTALPVAVQPCNQSGTTNSGASQMVGMHRVYGRDSSNSSSATCSNANSGVTSSTPDLAQVFLNSQKSARLVFGVYAPVLLERWTTKGKKSDGSVVDQPYALYLAPLIETGFDTSLNGLNQTQQQGSTPAQVQPVGNSGSFYRFYQFGFRLGHYGLSGDKNVAHSQISFLDVGWGRFSNMPSLLCPSNAYNGSACSISTTPTSTSASIPLRHSNDFRLHVEGLLEVPATGGFSVGFSTNVAAKGVNPSRINGSEFIHIRPPDDLRFFFGYKFDISAIAAKLAKK